MRAGPSPRRCLAMAGMVSASPHRGDGRVRAAHVQGRPWAGGCSGREPGPDPAPPRPAGPARLGDPYLRLSAPHTPDGPEGGHGAGQGRPGEGGREQGQPLQPTLPGRVPTPHHPSLPLPGRRWGPRMTFSAPTHTPYPALLLLGQAHTPEEPTQPVASRRGLEVGRDSGSGL